MHSLDLSLLEKVRHHPSGKINARCPACAEAGGDRGGNHLVIFSDGKFACAAAAGDAEHRRRIASIAGIRFGLDVDPWIKRSMNRRRADDQGASVRSKQLVEVARNRREDVFRRFAWPAEDVWDDSPQRVDSELVSHCPKHFIKSLFPSNANIWAGELHQSGSSKYSSCWRTSAEWGSATDSVGPMTTPAIWKPGVISRSLRNCLAAPYTVLDFDGLDGIHPASEKEHLAHILTSLSIIRWIRERHHWKLAAILHTGGKSLHAWFHTPPDALLVTLRDAAPALGIDVGLIGHPEHPCRLPGQTHGLTMVRSEVLWVQTPDCE